MSQNSEKGIFCLDAWWKKWTLEGGFSMRRWIFYELYVIVLLSIFLREQCVLDCKICHQYNILRFFYYTYVSFWIEETPGSQLKLTIPPIIFVLKIFRVFSRNFLESLAIFHTYSFPCSLYQVKKHHSQDTVISFVIGSGKWQCVQNVNRF